MFRERWGAWIPRLPVKPTPKVSKRCRRTFFSSCKTHEESFSSGSLLATNNVTTTHHYLHGRGSTPVSGTTTAIVIRRRSSIFSIGGFWDTRVSFLRMGIKKSPLHYYWTDPRSQTTLHVMYGMRVLKRKMQRKRIFSRLFIRWTPPMSFQRAWITAGRNWMKRFGPTSLIFRLLHFLSLYPYVRDSIYCAPALEHTISFSHIAT